MNYRLKTVKTCPTCEREFRPWASTQRWCSVACIPSERERGLGSRRQGRQRPCAHCGTPFYAKPSEIAKGAKFCSRDCFFASGVTQTATARSKRKQATPDRSGTSNPNFKHGKRSGTHIRGFNAKAKGESSCRNCGVSDVRLHLHHAIPRSLSRAARNNLLNGVPLCPKCHTGWHCRTVTIYRDIFTPEEWAYISSVQLTGQNIGAWLDDRYPDHLQNLRGGRDTSPERQGTVVSRTRSPREDTR